MPSGAIRSDVSADEHVTPGENRPFIWTVRDNNNNPLTSMVGWTAKFYLIDSLGKANGIAQLEAEAEVVKDCTVNVPTVSMSLEPDDLLPLLAVDNRARRMAYEVWRTNVGNTYRIAFGAFVIGL